MRQFVAQGFPCHEGQKPHDLAGVAAGEGEVALRLVPCPPEPARPFREGAEARVILPKIAAGHDLAEDEPPLPLVGRAIEVAGGQVEAGREDPRQPAGKTPQPQALQHRSGVFRAVAPGKQHGVVAHLPQPDALAEQVAVDVVEHVHLVEGLRGDRNLASALRKGDGMNRLRTGLPGKPALQPEVAQRVGGERRGEVVLHRFGPLAVAVRVQVTKTHASVTGFQITDDVAPPPHHPHVDVPRLSQQRDGVERGHALSFQDAVPPAVGLEPCAHLHRLAVQEPVGRLDLFGHGNPLHQQSPRRSFPGRQLLDAAEDDARHGLFLRQLIEGSPVLCGKSGHHSGAHLFRPDGQADEIEKLFEHGSLG